MRWILLKNRLKSFWQLAIIIVLLAFIASKYRQGDMQIAATPSLSAYSLYEESYDGTCFILVTGHVTNYGSAYATDSRIVCRVMSRDEILKTWEMFLGGIPKRSQAGFVKERVDIPCSKVTEVACRAECLNCWA